MITNKNKQLPNVNLFIADVSNTCTAFADQCHPFPRYDGLSSSPRLSSAARSNVYSFYPTVRYEEETV